MTTHHKEIFDEVLQSNDAVFMRYLEESKKLTYHNFSNSRRLFNPIYISNICENDCSYCGFRKSNKKIKRLTLTQEQSRREVKFVFSRGVKHLLVLAGDYFKQKYFEMLINHVSSIKKEHPAWIGLEVAPMETGDYRKLSSNGVNSIVIFQETYDKNIYQKVHGKGSRKSEFIYRYQAPFRALDAGINEIGMGVLYGLSDYYSDTLSMINHANEILRKFPNAAIRFSFPRIQKASSQLHNILRYKMTEEDLKRVIVAIRLIFPKTRIALTARESLAFRMDLIEVITDVGEAGKTSVGGYSIFNENNNGQFYLKNRGTIEDLIIKAKRKGICFE